MKIVLNSLVSKGYNKGKDPLSNRAVTTDIEKPFLFFNKCPIKDEVNLLNLDKIANEIGIKSLVAIDETKRLGLGSFKALGAVYTIAKIALGNLIDHNDKNLLLKAKQKLKGVTFSTASAGNHGLSLAAGARLFGAKSIIYVSKNVPKKFIGQLEELGAKVLIIGNTYDESLQAAIDDSKKNNWTLISDSTWENYDTGLDVMEGYLISISQALKKIKNNPTHIFLQAGVGGLAASFASYCRKKLGYSPIIIIVEPGYAPCLQKSIVTGKPVVVKGQASDMGRLDCKYPSRHAFYSLSKTANAFVSITETESIKGNQFLSKRGIHISQSSSAGFVALSKLIKRGDFLLDSETHALCVFSEGDVR